MMKFLCLTLLLHMDIAFGQNCNFNINFSNFVGEVGDSEQSLSHEFTIKRGSNSNNCKNFRAFYGKGNANTYNRRAFYGSLSMSYNLYFDSALTSVLKNYGDANSSEYIQGTLSNNNTDYTFNHFVKVINLDSVFSNGPGYYGDLIPISFYSVKNNGTLIYQTTAYFWYQFVIPRYAELSLGSIGESHDPSSTQHTLNFGTIENFETQTARLSVKGNVPFGIFMSSQNGGKLINGSSFIDYTISLDNGPAQSLSVAGNSYYMGQSYTATSIGGTHYPLRIQLQSLSSNASTGTYTDVITVTVNAY